MNEFTYESFLALIKSIKIELPRPELPKLRIRDLIARVPIVQGGMGVGISLSGLASAVASRGGVGVIAANGIGMIETDYFKDGRAANVRALRSEIRKTRARSKGIVGVNIMVALNDFEELLAVSIEEKVDLIIMGAGLPIKNIPVADIRKNNIKVAPIVSTARAADLIFKMWKRIYGDIPDAVIVEGPEAGGHLGVKEDEIDDPTFAIEKVVPEVRSLIDGYADEFHRDIPVIAAGGIFTGEDIYRIMKLGAQGVQMGTRFVATDECDADIKFKQAYVSARKEDIGIIKSPVGLPGRAILNDFLKNAAIKKRNFNCPWRCLAGCQAENANYCISLALNNARRGNLAGGFVFVGSNAYRVEKIVPVRELMQELESGYMRARFADMKESLRDFIEKIRTLRREYQAAEIRWAGIKQAYEKALAARISSAGKGSISRLREEYRKTAALLTDLHLRLTERIFEAYEVLIQG